MLYALRYQKTQANSVASLINLALEHGVSREDARVSPVLDPYIISLTLRLILAGLRDFEYRRLRSTPGRLVLRGDPSRKGSVRIERSQSEQCLGFTLKLSLMSLVAGS